MIAGLSIALLFASGEHPAHCNRRQCVAPVTGWKEAPKSCGRKARFRGDKPVNNGDNPHKSCRENCLERALGKSSVIVSRQSVLLIAAVAGCVALPPLRAHAQWWSARAPVDFEECADLAEKAATKEARASELSGCNSKFAGRRKPGGGYTYFDFMQNRSFDIAGPNPTPEEQKNIDEQYTAFLDKQRRSFIAASLAAKQEQQQQQASLRNEKASVPAPVEASNKPKAAAGDMKAATSDIKARTKAANCAKHSTFSCEWPVLSEKINNLKKVLFRSSQANDKRS